MWNISICQTKILESTELCASKYNNLGCSVTIRDGPVHVNLGLELSDLRNILN